MIQELQKKSKTGVREPKFFLNRGLHAFLVRKAVTQNATDLIPEPWSYLGLTNGASSL